MVPLTRKRTHCACKRTHDARRSDHWTINRGRTSARSPVRAAQMPALRRGAGTTSAVESLVDPRIDSRTAHEVSHLLLRCRDSGPWAARSAVPPEQQLETRYRRRSLDTLSAQERNFPSLDVLVILLVIARVTYAAQNREATARNCWLFPRGRAERRVG